MPKHQVPEGAGRESTGTARTTSVPLDVKDPTWEHLSSEKLKSRVRLAARSFSKLFPDWQVVVKWAQLAGQTVVTELWSKRYSPNRSARRKRPLPRTDEIEWASRVPAHAQAVVLGTIPIVVSIADLYSYHRVKRDGIWHYAYDDFVKAERAVAIATNALTGYRDQNFGYIVSPMLESLEDIAEELHDLVEETEPLMPDKALVPIARLCQHFISCGRDGFIGTTPTAQRYRADLCRICTPVEVPDDLAGVTFTEMSRDAEPHPRWRHGGLSQEGAFRLVQKIVNDLGVLPQRRPTHDRTGQKYSTFGIREIFRYWCATQRSERGK